VFSFFFSNRREVTSKVNDNGKELKKKVVEYFKEKQGMDVSLSWSQKCGCTMCPCSPGFNILVKVPKMMGSYSGDEYLIDVFIGKDGGLDVRSPRCDDKLIEVKRNLEWQAGTPFPPN